MHANATAFRDLVGRLLRVTMTSVRDRLRHIRESDMVRRLDSAAQRKNPARWLRTVASVCAVLEGGCASTASDTAGVRRDAAAPRDASDGGNSADADDAARPLPVPRLLAPLSTSYVTHRRPTLRWINPPDVGRATVEVCRDRACLEVEEALTVEEDRARPTHELSAGVHFWRVSWSHGEGTEVVVRSPTWEFLAPAVSSPADTSAGSFVDVEGDGFADLLVPEEYTVVVYRGSREGLSQTPSQGVQFTAPNAARYLRPSPIGDVNGDGFGDVGVAMSCPARVGGCDAYSGQLAVLLGSESGLVQTGIYLQGPVAGVEIGSARTDPAGDINEDGYADVVTNSIRPPGFDDNLQRAVAIFLGGPGPMSTTPAILLPRPPGATAGFGALAFGAGDINGDGHDDIFVGEFRPLGFAGRAPQGYIYFGSGREVRSVPTARAVGAGETVYGDQTERRSPCDINRDGMNDVVLAGSRDGSYSVAVFLGRHGVADWSVSWWVDPPAPMSRTAVLPSCGGDLNSDGYSDLLVHGGDNSLWVLFGASSQHDLRWSRFNVVDGIGNRIQHTPTGSLGGPVDGSGYAAIVIGIESETGSATLPVRGVVNSEDQVFVSRRLTRLTASSETSLSLLFGF